MTEEVREIKRQIAAERAAASPPAEPFTQLQIDVIGAALGEIRHLLHEEIQTAIGELRAEFNVQRAAQKADVIDLPALPRRRVHAA